MMLVYLRRYVSPKFKSLSSSTKFLVQLKNILYLGMFLPNLSLYHVPQSFWFS